MNKNAEQEAVDIRWNELQAIKVKLREERIKSLYRSVEYKNGLQKAMDIVDEAIKALLIEGYKTLVLD